MIGDEPDDGLTGLLEGAARSASAGDSAASHAASLGQERLWEWPRTVTWMETLAGRLASAAESGRSGQAVSLPVWGVLPRNLFFMLLVLAHGFRRTLPPY